MSKTTMSIAIPDSMRAYVSARVESGAYGNMSEYFRELVLKDQFDQAKARLRTYIEEGLDGVNQRGRSSKTIDRFRQPGAASHCTR